MPTDDTSQTLPKIIHVFGNNIRFRNNELRVPSSIDEVKRNLEEMARGGHGVPIFLQFSAHGTRNGELLIQGENQKLSSLITTLTRDIEDKSNIICDVFACHVGSGIRTKGKNPQENEYRKSLAGTGVMVILNGGKYETFANHNEQRIDESVGKSLPEVFISRMLWPATLKVAYNEQNRFWAKTNFVKFGALKLQDAPSSPKELIRFIEIGTQARIEEMAEFLTKKYPDNLEEIRELENRYKLIASSEDFKREYLQRANAIICSADKYSGRGRTEVGQSIYNAIEHIDGRCLEDKEASLKALPNQPTNNPEKFSIRRFFACGKKGQENNSK